MTDDEIRRRFEEELVTDELRAIEKDLDAGKLPTERPLMKLFAIILGVDDLRITSRMVIDGAFAHPDGNPIGHGFAPSMLDWMWDGGIVAVDPSGYARSRRLRVGVRFSNSKTWEEWRLGPSGHWFDAERRRLDFADSLKLFEALVCCEPFTASAPATAAPEQRTAPKSGMLAQ